MLKAKIVMENINRSGFTSLLDQHILDICENMNRLSDGEVNLVGIGKEEEQHRLIIVKYNEFISSLMNRRGPDDYVEKFKEMMKYINIHFLIEEKVMKMSGYEGYVGHKSQHDNFTETVNAFATGNGEKKTKIEDMAMYIGHWLIGHMLISDVKFEEFMNMS